MSVYNEFFIEVWWKEVYSVGTLFVYTGASQVDDQEEGRKAQLEV